MNNIKQILLNIVGGAITVALIELGKYILAKIRRRKFKAVFGKDAFSIGSFHLVYAQLTLPTATTERGDVIRQPYQKPGEERLGARFSIERPVSSSEIRAAKYLAETIAKES